MNDTKNKTTKTEAFIKKAKEVHNNKYRYDKTEYILSGVPLIITCPIHGDFKQRPFSHIRNKQGCRECAKDKLRMTKETFLLKAHEAHGNRYDYTLVEFIDARTAVTIQCKEHGPFKQKPTKHIKGQGCPKCAYITPINKILSKAKKFIDKANKVHNGKYLYIPESYSVKDGSIKIICPIHGEFTQNRFHHISGSGCKQCGIVSRVEQDTLTTEEFIERSRKVHGDLYDYSKTKYINSKNKVTIRCRVHGDFEQIPWNHYNGAKCVKCQNEINGLKQSNTVDDFIKSAIKVHGTRYNYDKVIYFNNKKDVIVTCNIHGDFRVRPDNHLHNSAGCPICSESKGERKIRLFLELNGIDYKTEYIMPDQRKYRYDFYLPELNILIEFDGLQHFKPIKFFGGEKAFKIQKKSDVEKNHLAKINKIPLIRIPFTKLKNIEEYLTYMLCKEKMYVVNNKYYRNILDLCKGEKLPMDTSPKDVVKFKLKNKLILHVEKHVE